MGDLVFPKKDPNQQLASEFLDEEGTTLLNGLLVAQYGGNVQMHLEHMRRAMEDFLNAKGLEARVTILARSNNKVFKISVGDQEIVAVISKNRRAVEDVKRTMSNEPWPVKNYGQVTFEGGDLLERDESNPEVGSISFVELLPNSLGDKINAIHNIDENSPVSTIKDTSLAINLAKTIGPQVSDMLKSIHDNNIIWTDMKPGNIMLRENDKIVGVDFKGYSPIDKLLKDADNVFRYDFNTDPTKLPRDHQNNFKNLERTDMKEHWDKVNCFQLGTMLHTIGSGEQYIAPNNTDEVFPALNFDGDVFQTEEGGRLKMVIEGLMNDDPNKRFHHTEAAKMLANLGHENNFKAEIVNANTRIAWQQGSLALQRDSENKKEVKSNEPARRERETGVFKNAALRRNGSQQEKAMKVLVKSLGIKNKTDKKNITGKFSALVKAVQGGFTGKGKQNINTYKSILEIGLDIIKSSSLDQKGMMTLKLGEFHSIVRGTRGVINAVEDPDMMESLINQFGSVLNTLQDIGKKSPNEIKKIELEDATKMMNDKMSDLPTPGELKTARLEREANVDKEEDKENISDNRNKM